ncbi:MAG: M1 family metallopeptidase [Rhizomicrobium sp.]|jgi:aminopeptidase N
MRPATLALALLIASASQSVLAAPERIVLPVDVAPLRYEISVVPDAAAMTFTGAVKIDIEVLQQTSRIELNAAELTFSHVALSGVAGQPQVSFDTAHETSTLTFAAPIALGRYVLSIDYAGKINDNAAGLFYLDYDTAEGRKRALFTQFENSDARRFVPCWDEPARKATFTLSATVPADEMAVSNMPVATRKTLGGGLDRVRFAETPKMSSYLLFFGLGDFERISRPVNGVDVGVIVKRGDTAEAQYALDAASHILPYYEDYFGVKYPLPKLDLVAGPGQSQFFGAMENWGAIFFFERDLLIDPKISTEADKRGVTITVAHEMAHQWFGDLVTMDWWDDIWLNEGFASWMEYKATDRFNPQWNVWLRSLGSKEAAMRIDARAGTHPIIQPIVDVLQANEAFDTITYSKGQSVIRMLENYIGENAFRAGVRAYMKAHAYGNTVTDDLWKELDKTAPSPISGVAHDFTLQAGVPLIRVTTTRRGIHLTQDRLAADETGSAATVWRVPVVEKALGGKSEWRGLVSRPADIAVAKGALPIVNAGQAGYFRTLYDKRLSARLAAHFRALAPADQLGLLGDGRALGYSGYQPLANLLALTSQARPAMNPQVLADVAGQIAELDTLYRGLPGRAAFRAYGLSVLRPLFAKIRWSAKPGEDANASLLRMALLAALNRLDDPKAIAKARRYFTVYVKNPARLSGDLRSSVLSIVAAHADAATWEQLHALAKNAQSSLEKRQFYALLGAVHDRALAERALDLALSDEAPVTMRPAVVDSVAAYYPEMAFDFTEAHFDAINTMLEPDSRNEFAPQLAQSSTDPAMIAKLEAFAGAHIPATARQATVKAEAAIAYAAMVRAKRLPEIDRWLKRHRR